MGYLTYILVGAARMRYSSPEITFSQTSPGAVNMLKLLSLLSLAILIVGCSPEVQSSASRVLDNAGSVSRTAGDNLIMKPVKPTGRASAASETTEKAVEKEDDKKKSS